MDRLMTRYFQDAHFSENDRTLFAFASYATPVREISRKCASLPRNAGSDPDKWFNNVEMVTAEKIGLEPVTYVRNIYKYYVSLSRPSRRARPGCVRAKISRKIRHAVTRRPCPASA